MSQSLMPALRYLEEHEPIVFSVAESVPETELHVLLRTLLFQLLKDEFEGEATVGSDQFVYFDATDPRISLAPDVYARRGVSKGLVTSWKVWERGAPEVAVEIVSNSDAREAPWQTKFARYARMGVTELVRFDADDRIACRVRSSSVK